MSHAPGPAAPADAPEELTPQERMKRRFEILFGLIVTIFAAVLALNELASGKYGDDELQASAERTSAYLWYQSKGIKETEVEGQRDMMKAFVEAGIVPTEKATGVLKQVEVLSARVDRYGKEKKEILEGSKAVGRPRRRPLRPRHAFPSAFAGPWRHRYHRDPGKAQAGLPRDDAHVWRQRDRLLLLRVEDGRILFKEFLVAI